MHHNDLSFLDFVVVATAIASAEIPAHNERRCLGPRRRGQTHADNDSATHDVSQQHSAIDCVHGFLLSEPSYALPPDWGKETSKSMPSMRIAHLC
jgi:hypothetical protein